MTVLLLADNPDSQAWSRALSQTWPAHAPAPVMAGLEGDSLVATVGQWLAVSRKRQTRPVLFAVTSRRYGCALAQHIAAQVPVARICVGQEYWGDRCEFGTAAITRYFVRDKLAATLTLPAAVEGCEVTVAGTASCAWMEDVDSVNARLSCRAGMPSERALALWLGQAPQAQDAYVRSVRLVAGALKRVPGLTLLYRPHPRESRGQIELTEAIWSSVGVNAHTVVEGELCAWLAAADVVMSCFSNGCTDAVHLNRVAPFPYNRSIFAMPDAELRSYHVRHTGLEMPPMCQSGLALYADTEALLEKALADALDADKVQRFWSGPLRSLATGREAARTIATQLCELI